MESDILLAIGQKQTQCHDAEPTTGGRGWLEVEGEF